MIKFLRKLSTVIRDGFKGIWVHRSMGLASVISTLATLFVVGLIIIVTVTVNNVAGDIKHKVDEVEIFLEKDISDIEKAGIEQKIMDFGSIRSVEFKSSEDAMESMKATWGDSASLLEGLDSKNLLPASFVVKLDDISKAHAFVNYIKTSEKVDDVKYYQSLIDKTTKISKYVEVFGLALVAVLVLVSLFIISNTIKLTVFSRKDEIAVMKYVGADNHYIRIPFIIEGLFFGLLGSLLAFALVFYAYKYAYTNFASKLLENLSVGNLSDPEVFKKSLLSIFVAIGAGIGVIGSVLSLRKYLRV